MIETMKYLGLAVAGVIAALVAVWFLPFPGVQYVKAAIGSLIAVLINYFILRNSS